MKYIILILTLISFNVNAIEETVLKPLPLLPLNEIEEVVVVGAKIYQGVADPTSDNILTTIEPTRPFVIGAFNGLQLSGTDTKHTGVFKNGIPVNDPSSGWYDFGQDLSTNQKVTIISGANSVRYGSGSMAGVVLLEDDFGKGFYTTLSTDKTKMMVEHEFFQIATYRGTSGSVKTDNDEVDWYENKTFKLGHDIYNLEVVDYSYDYDGCYNEYFVLTDDCNVEGQKITASIDHDRFTLGHTTNEAIYNTGTVIESDRTYGDILLYDDNGHELGVTAQKETYGERKRYTNAAYYIWSNDNVSLGYRYEEGERIVRLGLENNGYRFSMGNSYRLPNLYEQFGDSWVSSNPNLLPEQGRGTELGYKGLSLYYYKFDEGIDFDMNAYSYINTGEYRSRGIRLEKNIGKVFVYGEITDSDKLRVPNYRTKIAYTDYGFTIEYLGEFDKGVDFDGRLIDDVSTFNISYSFTNGAIGTYKLEIKDVLDNSYEYIPDYAAGGRTFRLSWNLLW